jgi:GNAT superfamily N-acetyltransferase
MTGVLDIGFASADLSVRNPLTSVPSTHGERLDAEWGAAQAPDRYFNITGERRRLWQESLDAYHSLTGERLPNPYEPTLEFGKTTAAQEAERRDAAMQKFRAAREQFPELPDPELIDFRIAQAGRYARRAASERVDTGGGFGGFVGGVLGESVTPHGVAGAFVPPARLSILAAEAAIQGFLRSVGREAVLQAGVGVASQAAGELLDYAARKPLGTPQTGEEIAQNIVGAGVGGAVLGGGFRGLHEAWRRLRPEVRAAAPSSIKDAVITVERSLADEGTNPLPREAAGVHEQALERAQADVVRGRPARVTEFVATATEDAVDGPYLLRGVMPEGPPGVSVEVGRVRGTGFDLPERTEFRPGSPAERMPDTSVDRYVVARDENGAAIGVLRMTVADLEKKILDRDAGLTVYVRPENRRQGVATKLYQEAERQGYNVRDLAGQGQLTPSGAELNRALAEGVPGRPYDEVLQEARVGVEREHPRFRGGANLRRNMELGALQRVYNNEARAYVDRYAERVGVSVRHDEVANFYKRESGESIAQAAERAVDRYVDLEERRAMHAELISEEDSDAFITGRSHTLPEARVPSPEDVETTIKASESKPIVDAINAEIEQLMKLDPERTITLSLDENNVRTVKVRDLIDEVKKQEQDAKAIEACASGAPF